MEREERFLEICKGIRSLDGESVNSTIEFIETPCAKEQRDIVRKLLRKGYSNAEIYSEVNRVFGTHSILKVYCWDVQDPKKYLGMGIVGLSLGFGIAILRKAIRK
ncbi:unnamed protein product [Paramecium octaurelia]|uniref:Uncharacterized protein n=1 Tax=Paramecium octaurelia TaxID=43137 RepID=A0A8S1SCL1_PAROT|nr:unnamed protein product [Paramecium octaurelia]